MQKIIPHLWFDKEAVEAVNWYVSLFDNSSIQSITTIPSTPSGDAVVLDFQLSNLRFNAINAGPYFTLNPSISLMVACNSVEEVENLHAQLSAGGAELMELGEYPFSKRYAWVQDKYGLSWQLFYNENANELQKIRPTLLFAGKACGKAENALDYYASIFDKSQLGQVSRYESGEAMDHRATINYAEVNLNGSQILMMDHGMGGDFTFNEAFSLVILCEDQAEIDYYWEKLSFVPEAEQCGWLKDQYDVSWQVVPKMMIEAMENGSEEEIKRLTKAFLEMKKFDILTLEKALVESTD